MLKSKKFKWYKKRRPKTSKLETRFGIMLKKWGLYYQTQKKVGTKYYDFYLPKYNLLIEIMGDYWHGNKKYYPKLSKMQLENKVNDIYKKQLAIINKFNYIDIWENKINKNKLFVFNKLMNKIKEIESKNEQII